MTVGCGRENSVMPASSHISSSTIFERWLFFLIQITKKMMIPRPTMETTVAVAATAPLFFKKGVSVEVGAGTSSPLSEVVEALRLVTRAVLV